jgi:hypothetical protein
METDSNQVIAIAGAATKRSGWVTGVVVLQALWTIVLVALPIYLLILARSPGILNTPDGNDAARRLRVGAAAIALPALFAVVSSYGLWKRRLWGWSVALFSNTVMLGVLIYSMTDENTIDWDVAGVTLVSAILPILLLLPVVRKSYWPATESV